MVIGGLLDDDVIGRGLGRRGCDDEGGCEWGAGGARDASAPSLSPEVLLSLHGHADLLLDGSLWVVVRRPVAGVVQARVLRAGAELGVRVVSQQGQALQLVGLPV